MGGVLQKSESTASVTQRKLEEKITDAMRKRAKEGSCIKSFDSIILKFPRIDESLRKCKATFQEFDEDGNGTIERQELKRCFHKLEMNVPDEEINDLFEACDINADMGMEFNEFIVLICLLHLLKDHPDPAVQRAKSRIYTPDLDSTLETLVNAFVFLDKNKDGHVSKKEMVQAINENTTGERSSGRIAVKRFEEMDWDNNGMVNFKEFLFAFTRWVGIEEDNEDEENV